jgi:uncharacterized protein YbaP (TraB family)
MKISNREYHNIVPASRSYRRKFLAVIFVALGTVALTGSDQLLAQGESALFWSISKDGEPAGYLLGTIHSEDPRVLDFPPAFIDQLNANQVFAMEILPDLPTLSRLTEYMQYQDGTTLESYIGPERYAALQSALSEYKVPADWITRMKVWAAMMTLSVPPPETGFFMDFSLSLRAAGAGLKVVGLETLEQQLSFLEDMPMKQQLMLLDQTLADHEKVGEIHQQMVDSYLAGNLAELKSQAEEQLDLLEPEAKQYFMKQGIEMRNRRMFESLLPHLQINQVFIAVGALHLPGESGLIQLLRIRGYDMTPLPLPVNGAGPASDQ